MCDTFVRLQRRRGAAREEQRPRRQRGPAPGSGRRPPSTHPAPRWRRTWVAIAAGRRGPTPRCSSRPWWMWGAEMGANEHGVVIGNEAVFTTEKATGEPGSARHGPAAPRPRSGVGDRERGRAGDRRRCWRSTARAARAATSTRGFSYHNSFLVADRDGRDRPRDGRAALGHRAGDGPGRSISNGLTIPGFAERHADRLRSRVARRASPRRTRTEARGRGAAGRST